MNTGYGMLWPGKPQDVPYYRALAGQAGFTVVREEQQGRTFFMELRK